MDNLEDFIFGDAFRDAVKKAVQDAVAEANAQGLPKAYDPDFSHAKTYPSLAPETDTNGGDLVTPANRP